MTFETARSSIHDWASFVMAVAEALTEAGADREQALLLTQLAVMKGLFVVETRELAAQLGLAITAGRTDARTVRLRARCLAALGREIEALPLVAASRFSPEVIDVVRRVRSELLSGSLSDETRAQLLRAFAGTAEDEPKPK